MYWTLLNITLLLVWLTWFGRVRTPHPFVKQTVHGSSCLDGTTSAFYASNRSSAIAIVHLQGGGWCETDIECLYRASTDLGSSSEYPKYSWNPDPHATNALFTTFSEWKHFVIPYCDGGSWLGDDRRALRLTLERIVEYGVSTILLTGCSAGGLAVVHS